MLSLNSLRARVSPRRQAICAVAFALPLFLAGTAASAQESDPFSSINWINSGEGKLGKIATLDIPAGCRFTDGRGAKEFLEITQNPYSGSEVGALSCRTAVPGNPADMQGWFVIFEYDASGYVNDSEKGTLDGDKILATLRDGQEYGNAEQGE